MNSLLNDIPSIPQIPSRAPLHLGITTRVMAKRQALERERLSKQLEKTPHVTPEQFNQSRRRSSKFLEGAAIPNSVLKGEIQQPQAATKSVKKEREEFVKKLLKRLQPQMKMYPSIYDENVDRKALDKIKKELQRRSLLPLTRDKSDDRASFSIASGGSKNKSIKGTKINRHTKKSIKQTIPTDPWEELKEKRRISRRTSILAPLGSEKRPTYESIKKAIQSSKIIQQLLDADNIEEQKIKQMQAGKSLISENLEAKPAAMIAKEESPTNLKISKKEGTKYLKERKGSKRKSSLKLEKYVNTTVIDRPVTKQRTSNDLRKGQRRSTPKTLKQELQMQSSLIINNILQQRKNTA